MFLTKLFAHNDVNLIKLNSKFLIIQRMYKNMFLYEMFS